jgi:hypothetical protein
MRKQTWSWFMANLIKIIKTHRFFTSFNQANAVYVKIYETVQLLYFLNQKTNIYVNFANVLCVAFSIPSGSLPLVKYPVFHICLVIVSLVN